jgi:hypothetical protein
MDEKEYILKKFNRNKYSYLLICFNSGISTLASLAINYYYKDKLKIQPSFLSQILAYMKLPYMIKPLYGLLTDIFPIFGYRRKLYIIFSSITCFLSWFLLSFFKLGVFESAFCLFVANVNLAFSSVLSQAIFVELGKLTYNGEKVGNTKDLVSVYFIVKNLGFVLAATLKGVLIELFSVETVFFINSLNQTMMFIAGFILIEERITDNNEEKKKLISNETKSGDTKDEKETKSGDTKDEKETKNGDTKEEKDENKQKAGTVSDLIKYIFQKKVLVPYIYVLIFLSTPAYLETMFYYCSNVLKLTANKFGIIQTYQMGLNLGIVFLYKNYLSKKLSFKQTLTLSKTILFITLIPNYFLVKGLTKNYINDFYIVLITTSSNFMVTTLSCLPIFDLAAKLSPKNLEGTVYALFTSGISFGEFNSTLFGSWLTKFYNISSTNFDNLINLIVTINMIILLPLPILYAIPNYFFEPETKKDKKEETTKSDEKDDKKVKSE